MIFLGLIFFLVLLEVGIRLGGGIFSSIQDYKNLESIKQKGAYRILCIGESTTQGQYPHLLEQALNQRNIGVRFTGIDKGRVSTDSNFLLSRIESDLAEYHPDMVVSMMGINDLQVKYYQEIPEAREWVFQRFRVYRLGRILWAHFLKNNRQEGKKMGLDKPVENQRGRGAVQMAFPETRLKDAAIHSVSIEGSFKRNDGRNSVNDKFHLDSGHRLLEQRNFPKAEAAFVKAIVLDPSSDRAYAGLGRLYLEQGELVQSEDCLKKAIALNPKSIDANLDLGRVYQHTNLPQTEYFLKKAGELDPGNSLVPLLLGYFYRGQKKLSQAEDCFKKAIKLRPHNYSIYIKLGRVYFDQKKILLAEECFKKAIERHSDDPHLNSIVALFYDLTGKTELANKYARKSKGIRALDFVSMTASNYHKLKNILDKKRIKLVCVQYPMRSVEPLQRIFDNDKTLVFVSNEMIFKQAVKKNRYKEYFVDMFAGDFGHCTQRGNQLLAANIADVILEQVFAVRSTALSPRI